MFRRAKQILILGSVLALLIIAPLLQERGVRNFSIPKASSAPGIPGCTVADGLIQTPALEIGPSDSSLRATFACGNVKLTIASELYLPVRPGWEAVSRGNRVVSPDQSLNPLPTFLQLPGGLTVREYVIDVQVAEPMLVWTWYSVDRFPVASAMSAKIREFWSASRFIPVNSGVFVVAGSGGSAAEQRRLMDLAANALWQSFSDVEGKG